jgi:pantoate--beta-alanine ligase
MPALILGLRGKRRTNSETAAMAQSLSVLRSVTKLRGVTTQWRAAEERIALVPTMGALHAGHVALVSAGRRRARRVVVSIFVNPAQFAPDEDLATYPRTFDADLALLGKLCVDAVWAPSTATMYPPGFATQVVPAGAASVGLEDRFRPHFFTGVATVVAKLLLQCAPDFALFGEKDYQQLRVVEQMAKDLDLRTKIIGVTTVREKDGLALSSRNLYLSTLHRKRAAVLHRVLAECAQKIAGGEQFASVLRTGVAEIEHAGFAIDYLEARHAQTLQPITSIEQGPVRLLLAARIGKTRLIDNVSV